MKILHKQIYGSQLFGTSTPNSDIDYKQIHIESIDRILLKKDKLNFNEHSNVTSRNTKDDFDFESIELRQFIIHSLQGQTYVLDLVNTPKEFWINEPDPIWLDLLTKKDKLVTKNISPMVGYVKNMSAKYSKKGDKLKELIKMSNFLKDKTHGTRLDEILTKEFVGEFEYFKLEIKEIESGSELYLFGPDCSFPANRKVIDVLISLDGKIQGYGKRVIDSMGNNGIDLKAYYHALRLTWELEEYLNEGKVTLPCTRASELLEIRNGVYSNEYVENWISDEIHRVMAIKNTLPEPDYDYWYNWLLEVYVGECEAYIKSYKK